MTEYLDTYCPVCDTEVKAELLCRPAELSVRGETVGFNETIAVCPTCGEVIGDARIEGDNLNRAYSQRAWDSLARRDQIPARIL